MHAAGAQAGPVHGSTPGGLVRSVLVNALSPLPMALVGALSVHIRHTFDFQEEDVGLVIAAFFGASAVSSIMLGRLVEAFGAESSLRVAAVTVGVGVAGLGAARGQQGMMIAAAVAGIAHAVSQPAVNLYIARNVDRSRHGLVFGLKQAGVPMATLLAGLAVAAAGRLVHWSTIFFATTVLAIVIAATLPRSHRARRFHQVPDADGRGSGLAIVVLAVSLGFGAFSGNAAGVFLVPAAVNAGLSAPTAGAVMVIASASAFVARGWFGWRADRITASTLYTIAALLLIGMVGSLILATGIVWLLLPGAILTFGGGWGWPGLFHLAVVKLYPAAPARATGITQTGGYVGAGVGPLVFGVLAASKSYRAAWIVVTLSAGVSMAGVVVTKRMIDRRRGVPAPPTLRKGGIHEGTAH